MSTSTALNDGLVVAQRNLIKIKRVPDLLVFTTLQPIMFVLLFAYVFGGAIDVQGSNYKEFLIAGIFTQTVTFGATLTGAGLADDMKKGIIDRFRSLPMSRSAVLVGRTVSDVANNLLVVVVMSLTGLVVGWRIRRLVPRRRHRLRAAAAVGLRVQAWIMAFVGLLAPSPEVVNNASFVVIFPVTFIANTFVPLETLPGVLKTFAAWNPCRPSPRPAASTSATSRRAGRCPTTGRCSTRRSTRCCGSWSSWRCSCRWPPGSTAGPPAADPPTRNARGPPRSTGAALVLRVGVDARRRTQPV
ncbi:hypothetical protein GCM10025868_13850 [Angustibacter aerolatus]|uniref:ABC-2 type transporter transmembrane domain-containing protein n=1 Tax=Angustibacter aerolatus TaxID=1162965 RepID=A0ABQ6JFY8_9ACTN|nr:hypothetical protein GCM10025868_13850 [Angustibacter aerolatus]